VENTLRALMKGVQASGEVPEENLDDVLEKVREERERQYLEEQRSGKTGGTKRGGKARAEADDDGAGSVDSMAMEVDEPGSDFGSSVRPQPGKKSATTAGKKAAAPTASRRKASGSGKRKNAVESDDDGDEDDEEIDDEEVQKPTRRTNRAAAPSNQRAGKRAPANKPAQASAKSKQTTLSFAPSATTTGRPSTRAAAGRARGKMANIIDVESE